MSGIAEWTLEDAAGNTVSGLAMLSEPTDTVDDGVI